MPIRFRCAYCNQLMGISRRKAGTVVRCPNCAGQVIVPNPDGSDPGTGKAVAAGGAPAPLFERNDFEDALHSASGGKRGGTPAASPPAPVISSASTGQKQKDGGRYEAEDIDFPVNLPAPAELPGIYLSPAMATLLSIALVVALALAFIAGLIVGRFVYSSPHEERADPAAPVVGADR